MDLRKDIYFYADLASFPASGAANLLYVDSATSLIYIWNGASYVASGAGGLKYGGLWNAATNNPIITSGVGDTGEYYIVGTAGTTNIDGISDWGVGDWIIFGGSAWQKIDNSEVTFTGYDLEIHVSTADGNDTTGDGSLLNPVATITYALTLVTAQRRVIVLHPGGYTENPTVSSGNVTIQTTELTGGNTVLYGTLTIGTAGSGARISGFSMDNLAITGTAQAYVSNCTINTNLTKSSSGYVEIINTEMQCTLGIQISGSNITIINGNKNVAVAVSNASAQVIIKGCNSVVTPSASAGNLAIVDCIVTALGGNGITITGASTTLTLLNSQVLVTAGNNVAPISVAGIYSIINTIYDKPSSTLTGTSTNSIDYFQYINADKFIKQGGTSSEFLKADGSVDATAYQAALTLTTTGTSGASTLVGSTLNVPQYAGGLTYFTEAESTAAPNATVPVNSLTPVTATTNADVAIVPKGTGAFMLDIPDNTTAGGNKRGANAIDLQHGTRSNADKVASGQYSVAIGYNNRAYNTYAVALGGGVFSGGSQSVAFQSATATGNFAFAHGSRCNSTGYGSVAFGAYTYADTTASGDNSFAVGSATASGIFAIAMSEGNVASAQDSCAVGGRNNLANSYLGYASGGYSTTNGVEGRQARGRALGTVVGETQKSEFFLSIRTTGNTATTVTVAGGAAGTSNQVILSNQSAYGFTGTIVGKQSGSTNACMWKVTGLIARGANAASTTLTFSSVDVVSNAPAWGTPTLAADTTNGGLRVQVVGLAATNIQWTAVIETTEVIYA